MKIYEKDSIKFEYKEFLNEAEYTALIKNCLEAYVLGLDSNEGRLEDGIINFRFNPISMERYFYRALCTICIDKLDDKLFDTIFQNGIHEELKDEIINANSAYFLIKDIANKMSALENILDINIQKIIDKIPNSDFLKNLPEEFNKIVNQLTQHNELINSSKKDFEEQHKDE